MYFTHCDTYDRLFPPPTPNKKILYETLLCTCMYMYVRVIDTAWHGMAVIVAYKPPSPEGAT